MLDSPLLAALHFAVLGRDCGQFVPGRAGPRTLRFMRMRLAALLVGGLACATLLACSLTPQPVLEILIPSRHTASLSDAGELASGVTAAMNRISGKIKRGMHSAPRAKTMLSADCFTPAGCTAYISLAAFIPFHGT